MLKAGQLYIDRLNKIMMERVWYDPYYMFYGGTGHYNFEMTDNNVDKHFFVSVDKEDRILGVVSYRIDWQARSAYNFGLMSFEKGSFMFLADIQRVVYDIFYKYNLERMEWFCFADNPAKKLYDAFIKKIGGAVVGCFHRQAMLADGKLHDSVMYEILKEDLKMRRKEG